LKIVKLFFILCILFSCSNIYSQTIAIINVQSLIDNNSQYISIVEKISNNQKNFLKNFEDKEKKLIKMLTDIENAKLILSENEINLQIDKYNKELNAFTLLVDNFNIHYQDQIFSIRETILKEIILILEKYATDNKIDLILDSTSYLIASNSLDITIIIKEKLEKINLQLDFKDFETN
tara:strand:- start:4975 stop:5508 length:534 start_codon:yes stop_codon:yes gene_type:complete